MRDLVYLICAFNRWPNLTDGPLLTDDLLSTNDPLLTNDLLLNDPVDGAEVAIFLHLCHVVVRAYEEYAASLAWVDRFADPDRFSFTNVARCILIGINITNQLDYPPLIKQTMLSYFHLYRIAVYLIDIFEPADGVRLQRKEITPGTQLGARRLWSRVGSRNPGLGVRVEWSWEGVPLTLRGFLFSSNGKWEGGGDDPVYAFLVRYHSWRCPDWVARSQGAPQYLGP